MKLTLREHWNTSTFRLAALFGVLFIIGNIALLSLIYWKTSAYLVHRTDDSIYIMSENFRNIAPHDVLKRVNDALKYDLRKSNVYGLFTKDGHIIAGNMDDFPATLPADGKIHQFAHHSIPPYMPANQANIPASSGPIKTDGLARALIQRLSNDDVLIVGRDFTQLAEIKTIILNALLVSGAVILMIGILGGFALSLRPLRRINAIRNTSKRIVQGELSLRLPVSKRQDELDMLAGIVNWMLEEIERLLTEVKSVTDTLAHDLRTPLTRIRLLLYRVQQQQAAENPQHQLLDKALSETDALLVRFRALLRISEIENQQRKAGFRLMNPCEVLNQIPDLFDALADDAGVRLDIMCDTDAGNSHSELSINANTNSNMIYADPDLLFEGLSNLVDNAIKFTPPGGRVLVRLSRQQTILRFDIIDTGCGIAINEREAVLQRRIWTGAEHRRRDHAFAWLHLNISGQSGRNPRHCFLPVQRGVIAGRIIV